MKICIAGNNITAKITFLMFKNSGIDCNLLAKKYSDDEIAKHKVKFINRTMAISKLNIDVLKYAVDIEKLLSDCGKIEKIAIFNSEKSILSDINFNAKDFGYNEMGYIIDYNLLCYEIDEKLKEYQIHENISRISYENEEYAIYDNENIKSCYTHLILTDSTFNEEIDFQVIYKNYKYKYQEYAITLNIEHTLPHKNCAIEWFSNLGPLASLPMKNQNFSNVVRTIPANLANDLMKMNEDLRSNFIQDNLISLLKNYLGDMKIINSPSIFPLQLQLNYDVENKNIIFLGTQNFIMHPIAGQGFNLIIRDIQRLKNAIINQEVEKFKKHIKRKIDIFSMLFATHNLNQFFKINNIVISKFRKTGMYILNNIHYAKKTIVKNAMGDGKINTI